MVSTRSKALAQWMSWLGCFLLVAVGCTEGELEPTPPPAPLTAEEHFDNFLQILKEQVETDGGYASMPAGSSEAGSFAPSASWSARVSHEYVPAVDGKPLKAVLTIHRKSEVTVVIPAQTIDEQQSDVVTESKEMAIAREFIPELADAMPSAGTLGRMGSSSIKTLPSKGVSHYEMQYEGDRWVVLTPLDEGKMPFTAAVIKYALDRQ